ncbi:MAG: protein kinase [Candidatus Solibacter sp.]
MSPHETIAHYRIVSKLGEGGMGAVYRATDTKLGRDVAIKVLPEGFAQDSTRIARFEREALVLASLNHPNIAAIYGIEQGAIVMELVEGADLSVPVPVDTAIVYANQIVAGLEAAHERGIIHRDLKPANIKVTPEGTVKLLDFGLAKAGEQGSAASSTIGATMSPTLSLAMTQAGMILGTATYMSPEQARGKPVDRRADIWAFGVMFYEMLTGTRLFGGGETVSDALAAVLTREPDFTTLPKDTPRHVRRLIERCLHKDPKLRLRDIGEARILLDEGELAQASASEPSPVPLTAHHSRWWMGAAAVLALGLAALSAIHFRETPPEREAVRFQVPSPAGTTYAGPYLSLSPDGHWLAFNAAAKGGQSLLWVRALDSLEARALPGTEGVSMHFWSPDSRFLGFWADGKLKKIEASGGPPQSLCKVVTSTAVAGWWNPDGVIFLSNGTEGIFQVPQAGGDPVRVTTPDTAHGEDMHWYPQILPDDRHFLYLILFAARENSAIYLGSLDGKEKKRLIGTTTSFRYLPPSANGESGQLLFLREGTLMAQPFNTRTFELSGDALPGAEHVGSRLSYGFFTVSPSGALAWRTGGDVSDVRQLTWFDRAGKPLGTLGAPAQYNNVALSQDATRAAVTRGNLQGTRTANLWLIDAARGIPTRFTFSEALDADPVWSPDDRRVAFSSQRDGPLTLYVKGRQRSDPGRPAAESRRGRPAVRLVTRRPVSDVRSQHRVIKPTLVPVRSHGRSGQA